MYYDCGWSYSFGHIYTNTHPRVCADTHTYIVKIIDVSKLYYKLNNID